MYGCLASLKCSLELLADQVSGILEKLGFIKLVPLVTTSDASPPAVLVSVVSGLDLNMILDSASVIPNPFPPVISDTAPIISLSSSKVLTTKIGGLESKMKIAMCNIRGMNNSMKQNDIIHWHKETNNLISIVTETKLKGKIRLWIINKFDSIWVFTFGLNSGHVGSGVAIVMDISLVRHVCKVSEVPGWLLSIKLLFKNKLSVSILGLYAGAFSMVWFSQTGKVNSLIAKTVNEFFFIVLSGDFNKNGLHKNASFKRCLDLGLVNSLGVKKTIDFVLVLSNLVNAIVNCNVVNMSEHFNIDYWVVFVSMGLGSLLDTQLNSFYRQTNRNCWKFDFRGADDSKWKSFKDATSANAEMFANEFTATIFRKKWFKNFDGVFTKDSSRFYRLELLAFKLVKTSYLVSSVEFALLLDMWYGLNANSALVVKSLFLSGSNFNTIHLALAKVRKSYHSFKLLKFRCAEEACIKATINKKMESFESDKSHTIRSVLECSFCKVVLDHLVVDNELVLEPSLVKSKYVFDSVFFDMMCSVSVDELLSKHCDKSILDMLLVLLNSCLIHESILSKILLDRISLACSIFDVLCGDNFSVLRSMTMQSLIFAIGSVVEDTLKKDCKLWLVLQNILVRIKMYSRFIRFFGNIHNDCINRVITDFGLTNGYRVHNSLDQREMFSPLFWCIFYDPLLCEVKKQADECRYRLNSYFISRCGCAESWAGFSFFFTVDVFINNTIWVGSSQNTTQHILNIASEFFDINNISINNDKTVVILINCKIVDSFLLISGSPISIAKREELHYYLEIYLSTESLFKPNLAKAHSDVWFFANLVLKKTVSNKQFSYLVLVVLFSIIDYRTQFSYVPVSACKKWDTLICKDLKSKFGLPCNFSSDAIHHLFLYGLKTFEQIQAENKLALVISFTNSVGILGHLFSHWLHDFQYPVHVKVNFLNNFLAGMVRIFSESNLSLGGSLINAFCHWSGTLMSSILGESTYFKCLSVQFLGGASSLSVYFSSLDNDNFSNILHSCGFSAISANLLCSDVGHLSVYMNGSLSGLGSVNIKAGAAVFFEDIGMSLGMGVSGLMSFTLTELQAIALALKCVLSSHSINLFSNSQAALDACKSELDLVGLDFRYWCWIEYCHIVNVICSKNLNVNWYKIKGHLGVLGNKHANELARAVALSSWALPHSINECYFRSVYHTHWEISFGSWVIVDSLYADIDWFRFLLVWHSNSHMTAGFTSKWTAGFQTYFMKALHFWLSVAMHKWLYDKSYLSIVCLFYGNVKVSDHVFSCLFDANDCCSFSVVLQLLLTCLFDILVNTALYKGFIFKNWFCESVSVFKDSKVVSQNIVAFLHEFNHLFWEDIWLVHAKHCVFIEKNKLIPCNGSVSISISGLLSVLSVSVIRLLGIAKTIGVGFSFHKSCLFFSGIGNKVSVHISV
ncbi:hypothetical protein G9A89_005733 [Geosiphon pyriformis]|nr:hypothetical protein G9A89_005733 [Geosiphon pyriformis]